MTEKRVTYPSKNGIPVPITEIRLPESELDLDYYKNYNKHHNCWPAKKFGKSVLYRTLRNLESQQFDIPLDVHQYLHSKYKPPKLPTPSQALSEIMRAADAGETLRVRYNCVNIRKKIGAGILKRVIKNCNELQKNRDDWKIDRQEFLYEQQPTTQLIEIGWRK